VLKYKEPLYSPINSIIGYGGFQGTFFVLTAFYGFKAGIIRFFEQKPWPNSSSCFSRGEVPG